MLTSGRIRVLILCVADAISMCASWLFAAISYKMSGAGLYVLLDYVRFWPVIFVFVGINWIARLYHGRGSTPSAPLGPVEEFRRLALSALATHILVMALLGFGHRTTEISRIVLLISGGLLMLIAQPMRNVFRSLMFALHIGQMPAYIIGEGAVGERLEHVLSMSSYYGFKIIKRFRRHETEGLIVAARKARIGHLFCCYKDDRFFRAQLPILSEHFNYIEYLPTAQQFSIFGAYAVGFGMLGGLEMVNQRRLKVLRWEKSFVDGLLSLMILILTSPLFLIVPIIIKLTSKGPVFYRAERLGKKGRPIQVWKFRSMYVDADVRLKQLLADNPALAEEWKHNFKLRHDPRITPVGNFLRKTSIDELPQLFNVFSGEMALIGPRPIVQAEVSYYGKQYDIFASVKPGITGLWQASGRSNCDYDERVALDVHYILNWSPWIDLWVVVRTAISVLTMRGAF